MGSSTYRGHGEDLPNLVKVELAYGFTPDSTLECFDNVEEVHLGIGRYGDDIWILGVPLDGMKGLNVALWVHAEHQAATMKHGLDAICQLACKGLTPHRPL